MGRIRKILEGVPANVPFRKYSIYDEADEFVKRFTDDQVDEMIDFIKSNEDAIFLYVSELSSQATGFGKTPKYESHLFWERDVDSFDKLEELRPVKESLKEDTLSFSFIVKDSYTQCCGRYGEIPTAEKVAEDIIDNYDGYDDVDVSTPEKYASWVSTVKQELNRQGLKYEEEEGTNESTLTEKIYHNTETGKWEVQSEEGKVLGEFDTEEEAKERLRQIEYFKHKNESEDPIDIEALEFYVNNWQEGDNITVTADLLNVLEKALKMAKQYSLKESNSAIDDYLKKFKKDNNDRYYVLDDEIDQVNREIADFGYSLQKASHGPGPGEWYFLKPIEDSERPVDDD